MEFNVDVRLHNLHCITPTDPSGEDEPYLWAYFVKVDGTVVRQRVGDPTHLTATVSVHSGSGRPGNLGVPHMSSGGNVHIPPAVGQFNTLLRPIVLDLEGGGQKIRAFIPGTILTVAILIDEEAVPRDATEGAFNDVRQHIQNRLNDLFNGLDLAPIIIAAMASPNPVQTASNALTTALADFQTAIVAECQAIAIQSAQISVMAMGDWWNPVDIVTQAAAALDPDEVIGSATLRSSEQRLIDSSLHVSFPSNLRQSSSGLGGAWYTVVGGASANLRFAPGDHSIRLAGPPARRALDGAMYTITRGRRCLDVGTDVSYTRIGFTERHVVSVVYPFLNYRFFLDDVELVGDAQQPGQPGKVSLNKAVKFPDFDETKFYLIGGRTENRTVTLSFETRRDPAAPQLQQLFISNEDQDGCYDVTLRIEAVLPDGQIIPVGVDGIRITGQAIELDNHLLERYTACIAQYLKSLRIQVKPTVPDQWKTPEIRWHQLDAAVTRLEGLRDLQLIAPASVDAIKARIATTLGLSTDLP